MSNAQMFDREKVCNRCGETWPADTEFFYRAKGNLDGLAGECIACKNAYDWRRRKGYLTERAGELTCELQTVFARIAKKYEQENISA